MKHLSVVLLSLLSTVALASSDPDLHLQPQPGLGCGTLMTEVECTRHLDTLARLVGDLGARQAYLDQHMALMREREALCACTASPQSLARAVYR